MNLINIFSLFTIVALGTTGVSAAKVPPRRLGAPTEATIEVAPHEHNGIDLDLLHHISSGLHQRPTSIDRNLGKCDFQCPRHSTRKPTRQCYDDFDDCECDIGWFRDDRKGRCVAREGLCTEEWFETMVEAKQARVEEWIEKADDDGADVRERYGYLESMNADLEEAWMNYNLGLASCQQLDEEGGGGNDDDRRALALEVISKGTHQYHRELFFKNCCKRIKRAVSNAVDKFVEVTKKAVRAVAGVVKSAGKLIKELANCGIGLIQDGLKCGGISCAFGISGAALDIAFTLATGGTNKVRQAQCKAQTKQKLLVSNQLAVLGGISEAVCAINQKFDSPVLDAVCGFSKLEDQAEKLLRDNHRIVLEFVLAFRKAFCGRPGSALTDILEEVVVCQVGCADDNNAFCPKV